MPDILTQALGVSAHWLIGGESDVTPASTEISREHILADRKTSVGLAGLAGDEFLCERLNIRSIEWRALSSLQPPNGLTRERYLVVLLALRGHRAT